MEDNKPTITDHNKHQQLLSLKQQQQQQQQQLLDHQPHHLQQRMLLLQQMQQQQKLQQAISRFPSNIDAHLRPLQRPVSNQQPQNPNPNPNLLQSNNPMVLNSQVRPPNRTQAVGAAGAPTANQVEMQMAYQDAWRVCHPDFKRPFSSLEDACERLLPYHVVADYEAEEDDRILDSDTTGQVLSRTQQWDQSIANKVAEFTATFEKQVLAFNIISRKRAIGEFRSEERLLLEQALVQEERRSLLEARAEMEKQQKAGREANMRMAAMAQAEQARAEMMARGPIRASAMGSMGEQEPEVNPDDTMDGWNNNGNNNQRDEKEPSEDFLNDEERENGDAGIQSDWREGGEFDLNTR
ncbi:putative GLTSCR protein region [Helianthus annuus]|nr:putative GLTSCR protein region [Helianthus annuus]